MIKKDDRFLYSKCKIIDENNYKDAFIKSIEVLSWIKNKKVYAIAANQIGIDYKFFVIRKKIKGLDVPNIIFNPVYTGKSIKIESDEYCFSFPDRKFKIKRYSFINFSYYDIIKKTYCYLDVNGLPAIIIQHETDHLDGKPDDLQETT